MNTLKLMKQIERRSEIPMFLKATGLTYLIAEVGVRFGYHFGQMLACNPTLALAIDHWSAAKDCHQDTRLNTQVKLDQCYLDVVSRFMHRDNARIIRASSKEAGQLFPTQAFDFVYVDADHLQKAVTEDLKIWWPKIRSGGVLAGHDYIECNAQDGTPFGIIPALAAFMQEKKIGSERLHTTKYGTCSWFLFKQEGE